MVMNVSASNGQERQKTRTINPSPEISRPYKHRRVASNRKGKLIFQFSFTRLMLSQNASILKFYEAAIHSSPTLCLYLIQFPRSDSLFQFRYVISLTLVALNISEYNRQIRLTCLHPCCHPIQITWWFIWEVTIVLFVHTSMQSVVCDKLHNCNLPNESSRDLNWVATRM